jgi:DNA helicase II / ATP-dependent DNA helicase PcrA
MTVRWHQIRAQAASVRAQYAVRTGAPAPFLLPLDDVAESLYQISVIDDPTLDPRILGELDPALGTIRVRPGLPPTFRRFLIGHEIGHLVLEGAALLCEDDETTVDERAAENEEDDGRVLQAYNTRERREYEANLFALELLLPADLLNQAVQQLGWSMSAFARQFGVSGDVVRTQIVNVCCRLPFAPPDFETTPSPRHIRLDPDQQIAVAAPTPALIIAGPGTGKTFSIVEKYLALVAQGVNPAHILVLTFSKKAAEELRERIVHAMQSVDTEQAQSIEANTFHGWGLNLLRRYGHHIDLPLDAQLLGPGDLYILLRRRIAELQLEQYHDPREPGRYLPQIISAISRAKDELRDPASYAQLAEDRAQICVQEAEQQQAGKTTATAQDARDRAARDAARLRELAILYGRYEAILRDEDVLDYGDLIMRAVAVLRLPVVADAIRAQYEYILVDEFQDINYAMGQLVALLDGGRGHVWAVGDPWQSIYRFRGASPIIMQTFSSVYPKAGTYPLRRNYRSAQPILNASHAVMAPDPLSPTRHRLRSRRSAHGTRAVVELVLDTPAAEAAAIAHDIIRRVGGYAEGSLPCSRPNQPLRTRRGVFAHRRHWRFADHAVLCRTHAQAARLVAVLDAHGVPADCSGSLLDDPIIKDALAICSVVGADNDAGMLRVLATSPFALDVVDLQMLVRYAAQTNNTLSQVVRDLPSAPIDPTARAQLRRLGALLDDLTNENDAWRVLTQYLFTHNDGVRDQIRRAANGDHGARRHLAYLGQLVMLARTFVRLQVSDQSSAPSFVAYVRLLIEAGEAPNIPPANGHNDAVRVMTIHAAKGLEFPIVFIPCLQEGQFPPRDRHGSIPDLPDLAHGDPPDELREERYLLYVAMTRARERLILSRAATVDAKPAARSVLLPRIDDRMGRPWPIQHLSVLSNCPPPASSSRLLSAPLGVPDVTAYGLEMYQRCPRQFLYTYGYCVNDRPSSYTQLGWAIRNIIQELAQAACDGALPAEEYMLETSITRHLQAQGLAGDAESGDAAEALRHAQQAWTMFRNGTVIPEAVDQEMLVQRPAGTVRLRVDLVERGQNGLRWVRMRTGRVNDDDHLKLPIMLYALAYQQTHGATGQIALRYTAMGTERIATPKPKVLENHTGKIDKLLADIQAEHWEPRPGHQCATCPFNLLCPA